MTWNPYLVARRALRFKRGQRKCSCIGWQILPTRINNNHWKLIYVSRTIPSSVAIATFEIYGWKFSGYLILICCFSLCQQNFSKANRFRVYRKLITWWQSRKAPISFRSGKVSSPSAPSKVRVGPPRFDNCQYSPPLTSLLFLSFFSCPFPCIPPFPSFLLSVLFSPLLSSFLPLLPLLYFSSSSSLSPFSSSSLSSSTSSSPPSTSSPSSTSSFKSFFCFAFSELFF